MGLLDDAAGFLDERRKREEADRSAMQARYAPWSADWTEELAGLLRHHGIPLQPVYIDGGRSEPVPDTPRGGTHRVRADHACAFWGEAWALKGWAPNAEWGPQGVYVLLQPSGHLWKSIGRPHSLTLENGLAEKGTGSLIEFFPDVRPPHRSAFFLVNTRPESGRFARRSEVGVPIAAALAQGPVFDSGWLVGVKP